MPTSAPPELLVVLTTPSPLRLRLLGRPQLSGGGLAADHRLERRDAALLLMLALQGSASRAQAVEWLWPELPIRKAQTHLRQRLFRLRKSLGLDLSGPTDDLLQLPAALSHDLQAEAEPARLGALEPVLLAGLLYDDCEALAERIEQARAQWLSRRLQLATDRVETLEAEGRLAEAIGWARHLILQDACSEHGHRRLMRLHYRRGDRTAALAAFRTCQDLLRRELGLAPGLETRELAALIERSGPLSISEPVPTPTPPVRPLTAALSAALRRPPRLLGRTVEWQALSAAFGRRRPVLLHGEAGIGKSRLAEDFAQSLGAFQCWKAHAGDQATPYGFLARGLRSVWPLLAPVWPDAPAWVRAELARLVPELGSAPPTPLEPLRLHQALAVLWLPWQTAGLGLLLLDDLQWADAASLESLLAGQAEPAAAEDGAPPGRPWLLCLVRSGEPWPAALSRWAAPAEGPAQIQLGPLPAHVLTDFVVTLDLPLLAAAGDAARDQAAALADTLLQRTGGRPLFMLELLRAGAARLPLAGRGEAPQLLAMITARLAALSAPALRLARVAALLGPAFSVERAAQVLAVHPLDLVEAFDELQAAQLMDGQGLAFDLAQEAALASVPPAIAQLLHRDIAALLQRSGGEPAVVAGHWHRAQCWAAAAAQFERAAEQARAASRRREELQFLDQAAQDLAVQAEQGDASLTDADRETTAEDLFRLSALALSAATVVETPAQIEARLDRVLGLVRNDSQRLRALLAQSRHFLVLSEGGPALAPALAAAALARQLQDAELACVATGWQGLALALLGRVDEALALFDGADRAAAALQGQRARLDFHGARGYVLVSAARYADARPALELAVELALALGDLSEALDQLGNLGVALQYQGLRQEALAAFEQAHALWLRMGRPVGLGTACSFIHLGSSYCGLGRYAEALEVLAWSLEQFRQGQAPIWAVVTENRLALVYLRIGQFARARQVMTALPAQATAGNRLARLRLSSQIEAALADRPGAEAALLPALLAAQPGLPPSLDPNDRQAFELLIAAFSPAEEALRCCDALLAVAGADGARLAPGLLLHAGLRRADALRRLGRGEAAARQVLAILPLLDHSDPLDLDRAAFWWLAAQALQAGGEAAAAQRALRCGRDWVAHAQAHLPAAFVPGFRERNPFNRALLAGQLAQVQLDLS